MGVEGGEMNPEGGPLDSAVRSCQVELTASGQGSALPRPAGQRQMFEQEACARSGWLR